MPSYTEQPTSHPRAATQPWRARLAGLLTAGMVASLVACGGGGGGSAGVGTGGTGSYAVGSISGFGSVIVNGVRYNDDSSSVFDDDDNSSDSSALALGMVVEIRGTLNDDGVSGSATSVSYHSELKGPVTAVNVGAGTLTVFGQLVNVTATTVFADAAGLADLAVGNVVEVYGLPDASGAITATRIEREASSIAAFGGDFRVRGAVASLTGTAPSFRFSVGTVTVTTNGSTEVDGTLADGVYVSVRLNKTAAGDGSYEAVRVKVKSRRYEDGVNQAEIEGLVSEFASLSEPFKVNGYPVQLDATVTYEDGVAGDLADGVRVEVKGAVIGGVLVVHKVEFDHEEDDGGADGSDAPFEFNGVATCSLSPCGNPTGSIVVHGETVQYDASTQFADGVTLANLNGSNVKVKAISELGVDGTAYRATRIELDD